MVTGPSTPRSVPLSTAAISLACGILLSGCVGTRVEYFTEDAYAAREQSEPVAWLAAAPARPYFELARITATSSNASGVTLRRSVLDRAGRLGADAVIPELPILTETPGPTPYYEPGLYGPMGAAFELYGLGWYTPFTSNPYIFVQGAVDQPRREWSLSGIAIRYELPAATAETPERPAE